MGRYVDVNLYFGKKKIKATFLIVAVILFALACLAVIIFIPGRGFSTVYAARDEIKKDRYIIHAGGSVTDREGVVQTYTNSLEALHNCYDKGNRIAEFDFMITSDGKVVCAHNSDKEGQWAYEVDAGYGKDYPATFEDFMNAEFSGTLTTMSLDDLAQFMTDHPDLYIVTDVKDDNEEVCSIIRRDHPDLMDNFIIQIYHSGEYKAIKDLGFDYIIYTLYEATDEELTAQALKEFVKGSNLAGVTFWDDFPESYADSFNVLSDTKIPMLVHTVNDKEEMKRFFDMGISAIYTDVADGSERYQ